MHARIHLATAAAAISLFSTVAFAQGADVSKEQLERNKKNVVAFYDNLVVVHTYSIFPESWRRKEWAGIDIFRVDERGKIVEHWDAVQPIPSSAAHGNGMF